MKTKHNILLIGADLTSNGGIASVIQSYYKVHYKENYQNNLFLLKTNFYKDKNLFFELVILFKSLLLCHYYLIFKNVSIVHVHTSANVSFYRKSIFIFISWLFRKKIIIHLHSSKFYEFFLNKNIVIKFIFNLSDCVVVLCNDWNKKLKEKYPNLNIKKIENPYNPTESNKKINNNISKNIKVLFMGFLIESKGIRDIIKVAVKLKSINNGNISIIIGGKGELETFLLDSINELSLKEIIKFEGWVSGEQKNTLYENADVFFLPSYKEGMPISILEAMSYGLPVVSTEISGIPDIIKDGENGYLIKPGNIDEMVSKLIYLSEHSEIRTKIKKNNLNKILDNSSDKIYYQINNLYLELLKEK